MEMAGSIRIPADRQRVWDALNDPDVLRQCIPGCEAIDRTGDHEFNASVRAKVGPVSARFTGRIELTDMVPPERYTITGQGSGGAAGFAKGGADVRLSDDGPGATMLTYTVRAQVGGKLVQIGSRLIDATARKYADEFFTKFNEVVAAVPEPTGAPIETPPPPVPVEPPRPAAPIGIWVWAAAAAAVTIIVGALVLG